MVFEVTTVSFSSGWDMILTKKGAFEFDNNTEIVPRLGQENMVHLYQ